MADFSEKWGTDVEAAVKLALDDLRLTIDEVDVTVLEEPSRGFFGIGSKLALVRVEKKKSQAQNAAEKEVSIKDENLVPCEEHEALDFLRKVTEEMGLSLDVSAKKGEKSIYLDISGKDSGTIIGKRGQTLDAIQYLTSLVVNKGNEEYTRVVVDAEHYRAKREKTLESLAYRLANKVVKTRRSVKLEPMNPYERKVIHAALHNHPKVSTRSEGQDPYRRVIIELK